MIAALRTVFVGLLVVGIHELIRDSINLALITIGASLIGLGVVQVNGLMQTL